MPGTAQSIPNKSNKIRLANRESDGGLDFVIRTGGIGKMAVKHASPFCRTGGAIIIQYVRSKKDSFVSPSSDILPG